MPRTIAIGDIHGNLEQLDALLGAIALTGEDHLVLLGDYVDRGPNSSGVLGRIMALKKKYRVSAIQGNHEEMMIAAFHGGIERLMEWTLNGGDTTLMSYGGYRGRLKDVPAEHWAFLEKELVPYVETESHIFVHANCYPDQALADQPGYMLRWERCDKIAPHQSGKVIVCGHTPQKHGRPMNKGFAVCIDTGAGFGRVLTALDVSTGKVWQANTAGRVTGAHLSDFGEGGAED